MIRQLSGTLTQLEVPLGRAEAGAQVRIAIRAGDIHSRHRAAAWSQRAQLVSGRVTAMRREGVTVIVTVEAGATFLVHLTPGASDDLQLRTGTQVWIVIKTYSCNLVEP